MADNYVNIITQWPGHSAEDIEKQITVPFEIQMAGIPDLKNLRSFSLAGISSMMMNFNDDSDNSWNRERVLERLAHGHAARRPGAAVADRLEPGRTDLLVHDREQESRTST